MPRVAGQIDVAKNEAILDAALEVLGERGLSAPMEEIARRAGVSKQTIYNHYGSKADLLRAIAARRVMETTAALYAPEAAADPARTLEGLARAVLAPILAGRSAVVARMVIVGALTSPEIGQAMYEAGSLATRMRLAEFLRLENIAGRLHTPDPMQAADFFLGMVAGPHQMAALMGVMTLTADKVEDAAREATARFLRAYAP